LKEGEKVNSNIVFAVFAGNNTSVIASHAWQYDYGQILRIQGLHLPAAVEVHFAIEDEETSTTRVGVTTNDITDVVIPDNCLENADTIESYNLYAYIYLTTDQAGGTGYKITIPVRTRAKPETFDGPEEQELFKEAIKAVIRQIVLHNRKRSLKPGHMDIKSFLIRTKIMRHITQPRQKMLLQVYRAGLQKARKKLITM